MATTVKIQRDTFQNFSSANAVIADGILCLETDTGKMKIGNGTDHYLDLSYILESITPDIDYRKIKIRRDTASNWQLADAQESLIPLEGEFCLETDTGKLKIGDGLTHYLALPYFISSALNLLSDIIFSGNGVDKNQSITIVDINENSVSRTLPSFAIKLERDDQDLHTIRLKDQFNNILSSIQTIDTVYGQANSTTLGVVKLYNEFGDNYDGSITQALARQFCVPTGTVIWYAGNQAPYGYIICNGQAISREDFRVLFSVIGTAYGIGNGSTTFNIPLLTDGRYIQGNTTVAGLLDQATYLPSHTHTISANLSTATYSHNHGGATNQVSANHVHGIGYSNVNVSTYPWGHITISICNGNSGSYYNSGGISANHVHGIYTDTWAHSHSLTASIGYSGYDGVVRPKSLTLLPCIKY